MNNCLMFFLICRRRLLCSCHLVFCFDGQVSSLKAVKGFQQVVALDLDCLIVIHVIVNDNFSGIIDSLCVYKCGDLWLHERVHIYPFTLSGIISTGVVPTRQMGLTCFSISSETFRQCKVDEIAVVCNWQKIDSKQCLAIDSSVSLSVTMTPSLQWHVTSARCTDVILCCINMNWIIFKLCRFCWMFVMHSVCFFNVSNCFLK